MKVKELKTGKVLDVNASYAARLIEQGRAVLHKEAAAAKEKAVKKTAGA